MKLSISQFFKYLKIKRKINNKSDFTTNEITKIKISLVDFHRKLNLLEKDEINNELEYLLEKFNLNVVYNFHENSEYFDISISKNSELLRPAYVDDNGIIYLKGHAQLSEEE